MSKISIKEYYCPVCGAVELHSTNHYGEIYCECNKCGNSSLYCKEGENKIPDEKCKIIFYKFNISKEDEAIKYNKLKATMKSLNYKCFDAIEKFKSFSALTKHDGETIGLFNVEQFDNQIVSTIGRVFYWYEAIWANKDIKEGYYLEF